MVKNDYGDRRDDTFADPPGPKPIVRTGARAKAHRMFWAGASVNEVIGALGLKRNTANGYFWEARQMLRASHIRPDRHVLKHGRECVGDPAAALQVQAALVPHEQRSTFWRGVFCGLLETVAESVGDEAAKGICQNIYARSSGERAALDAVGRDVETYGEIQIPPEPTPYDPNDGIA